jgi:hypothetical protein
MQVYSFCLLLRPWRKLTMKLRWFKKTLIVVLPVLYLSCLPPSDPMLDATDTCTTCVDAGTTDICTTCVDSGTTDTCTTCVDAGTTDTCTTCVDAGTTDTCTTCVDAGTTDSCTTCGADTAREDAGFRDCGYAEDNGQDVCVKVYDNFVRYLPTLIAEYNTCGSDADCAMLMPELVCTGSYWHIEALPCPVWVNHHAIEDIAQEIEAHKSELCIEPCSDTFCTVSPACIGNETPTCSQEGHCL